MNVRSSARDRIQSLIVRLVLCLVLVACTLMLLLSSGKVAVAQQDTATQVLDRINQARQAAGLAPFARNPQLDAAAQGHADDMLKNGSGIGHRGSDGSRFQQRIARAGYGSGTVGENWGAYRSLDKMFDFWLNDAPHRQNILGRKFNEIGIGVAQRNNGGLIIVTDFGGPGSPPVALAAAIEAQPTKKPKAQQPKPTAKIKPTQAPTLAPARKSKVKQNTQPTPLPPTAAPSPVPPPTQVAMAIVAPPRVHYELVLQGRAMPASLAARADARLGTIPYQFPPSRLGAGAALTLSGASLLAAAALGQTGRTKRRRK